MNSLEDITPPADLDWQAWVDRWDRMEGLPLPWHLDSLREHGFVHVDCFWRCDCDAIYGGIRN